MPTLLSPQTIPQSSMSAPLQTRQFGQSLSSSRNGLHPGAIFGIVAGVMLVVVIIIWCCMFRVWKKLMTNRDYGVLPSMRIAANRHGGSNNHHNQNQGYSQPLSSPYGPQPNFPGYNQQANGAGGPPMSANSYGAPNENHSYGNNPYGNGPYGDQMPPPYIGGQESGLTTVPAPSHIK